MAADEDHPDVQFEIELKEGEDWGVKLTHDLFIMGIRSGGPFDGKCLVGDQIVQVNDTAVKTIECFEQIIQQVGPSLHIQVARGLKTTEVKLLPPDREKNVQRRDGYSYHLAQVDYRKGCKFGLGIKHFQNKVLVSRVDEGSLSAKALVLGDRIVDINGAPVTDKDVARTMLLKSLQKFHTVSLVIERPESEESKQTVNNALHASEMQPPSVAMASDIQDIIKRQKQKMEKMEKQPPNAHHKKPGIIRSKQSGGALPAPRRVSIADGRKEVMIATDHEGKALKHVGGQK